MSIYTREYHDSEGSKKTCLSKGTGSAFRLRKLESMLENCLTESPHSNQASKTKNIPARVHEQQNINERNIQNNRKKNRGKIIKQKEKTSKT